MNCPKCGGSNIKVMDTMPGDDNRIFRRRKCLGCDTRFRTVEIMGDGINWFDSAYYDALMAKSPLYKNANDVRKNIDASPDEPDRQKDYQREYHRAYREKNREHLKEYQREYQREYKRKYRTIRDLKENKV